VASSWCSGASAAKCAAGSARNSSYTSDKRSAAAWGVAARGSVKEAGYIGPLVEFNRYRRQNHHKTWRRPTVQEVVISNRAKGCCN
jgi:hypothetical protein